MKTIKSGRNYVHSERREAFCGVYIDFVDSAKLVPRETLIRTTTHQQTIDKHDLPDIAPARQIQDALTVEQFQALGEYVRACLLCYERFRTTCFEEAVSNSNRQGGLRLRQQELNELHRYRYISEHINPKFRDFLEGFARIVEADVGTIRKRREAAANALYLVGERIVNRKDKRTQMAGVAGYLKAITDDMLEKTRDYYTILNRKRAKRTKEIVKKSQAIENVTNYFRTNA